MAPTEVIIPLVGASVAAFSSVVKNWLAKKAGSAIEINLGNGSRITVDGSEESREKVRKILSESLESSSANTADESSTNDVKERRGVERNRRT